MVLKGNKGDRSEFPRCRHTLASEMASLSQAPGKYLPSISQASPKPVSLPYTCLHPANSMRNRLQVRLKGMATPSPIGAPDLSRGRKPSVYVFSTPHSELDPGSLLNWGRGKPVAKLAPFPETISPCCIKVPVVRSKK